MAKISQWRRWTRRINAHSDSLSVLFGDSVMKFPKLGVYRLNVPAEKSLELKVFGLKDIFAAIWAVPLVAMKRGNARGAKGPCCTWGLGQYGEAGANDKSV